MATASPLSSTTVATQTARQTKSTAGYGLLLYETSLPARNFPTITTGTTETTMHPAAAAPRTAAAASIRRKNSPNAPRELLPPRLPAPKTPAFKPGKRSNNSGFVLWQLHTTKYFAAG